MYLILLVLIWDRKKVISVIEKRISVMFRWCLLCRSILLMWWLDPIQCLWWNCVSFIITRSLASYFIFKLSSKIFFVLWIWKNQCRQGIQDISTPTVFLVTVFLFSGRYNCLSLRYPKRRLHWYEEQVWASGAHLALNCSMSVGYRLQR